MHDGCSPGLLIFEASAFWPSLRPTNKSAGIKQQSLLHVCRLLSWVCFCSAKNSTVLLRHCKRTLLPCCIFRVEYCSLVWLRSI